MTCIDPFINSMFPFLIGKSQVLLGLWSPWSLNASSCWLADLQNDPVSAQPFKVLSNKPDALVRW